MNASGGLLALLVAFWALVLLPVWVRRHQDALAERSTESFTRAMRVLARRSVVTVEPEASAVHTMVEESEVEYAEEDWYPVAGPSSQQRLRRARTLFGLVVLTVLLLLAVAVTPLPLPVAGVGGVLLAGYLLALRVAARAESRPGAHVESVTRRSTIAEDWTLLPTRVPDELASPRTALYDAEAPVTTEYVIDLRDGKAISHWDPRDMPLPTYVQKNAMRRREITLEGGSWAGTAAADPSSWEAVSEAVAAAAEDLRAASAAEAAASVRVVEADEVELPRRAVND